MASDLLQLSKMMIYVHRKGRNYGACDKRRQSTRPDRVQIPSGPSPVARTDYPATW
uniref:Uncharacterized protein n=1 Tax=Anopheles funestus TaxID=62324 RepID=A0A4Y0BG08_ANOFN